MQPVYTLPATLTQQIADYLAQRPFAEVYLLLQALIKAVQEQDAAASTSEADEQPARAT